VQRSISSGFAVAGDVALPAAEVGFADHAAFAARATATLVFPII
jgi:hypothetical protein